MRMIYWMIVRVFLQQIPDHHQHHEQFTSAALRDSDAKKSMMQNLIQALLTQLQKKYKQINLMQCTMDDLKTLLISLQNMCQLALASLVDINIVPPIRSMATVQPEGGSVMQHKGTLDILVLQDKDIKQLIKQHFKDVLVESCGDYIVPKSRPYKQNLDVVEYPKGFVPPFFTPLMALEIHTSTLLIFYLIILILVIMMY